MANPPDHNHASDALFWDWDFSSGLMTWSGAIQLLFDSRSTAITLPHTEWLERIDARDREHVSQAVERVRAGAEVRAEVDYRVWRMDGTVIRVADRIFRAPPKPGQDTLLIGALKIIHEMNADESAAASLSEQLEASEARFRTFVDFLPLLAWEADADGWIYFYNRRWYEYTGATPEQMQGWGWISVQDPDDLARMLRVFRTALSTGKPWEDEFKLRRADGAFRWHLSRAMPVRDSHGRVIRWFGSNTDIHDQKLALIEREALLRAEHQLRQSAEQASREKDEFVAVVSHELRTPLSAIVGWIELLKLNALGEEQRASALDKIESNAQLLERLIGDLLDVSRIIASKLEIEKTLADVSVPLNEAIEAARVSAAAKQMAIVPDISDASAEVLGSSQRLQQVFSNLLSNAIKFSQPNQRIRVRLETAGGFVMVRVSDEGAGFEAGFQPQLFAKFSQADASNKRRYGGLGLGLWIAKHLVELHGGTIEGHSDGLGRGAMFTVRLPQANNGAPVLVTRSAQPAAPVSLAGIRVLAVDDDPGTREVLTQMLLNCGATVTAVGSAAEALTALRLEIPDALLSDLSMPEVDGYGLIERLRESEDASLRMLPAIALTALVSEHERAKALARGFVDFIAKPFDVATLSSTILNIVRARSLPQQEKSKG